MNFILQCGVLFTFLALGELIVWLTGIAVPSSILGMLLLTLSLKLRIVRLRHVDRIADFLTHNLGFFFVPAGVGLIGCLDLIAREWIPHSGSHGGQHGRNSYRHRPHPSVRQEAYAKKSSARKWHLGKTNRNNRLTWNFLPIKYS